MKTTGNTILITGGGTGIGRGLAEAFHKRGNTVVIAGRSRKSLDETVAANPGMIARTLDVTDAGAIAPFAEQIVRDVPALDALINMAGVMRSENLLASSSSDTVEATIATNLLGPLRLTSALLPHFLARPHATIVNVSSGLAFMPLAATPTYCATKAAIHSYSQSLRYQLRETRVEVIELIPPYVATELMGPSMAVDPNAMPLDDFIAESMALLEADASNEICVQRVMMQRTSGDGTNADYPALFKKRNDMLFERFAAPA